MKPSLYITADDLGLSREITDGIIYCAEEKLIHGTALLVNCPATPYAYDSLSRLKNIDVGLHLSLVEGYSLTGNKSLLDSSKYFQGDKACLYLNWRRFATDYLSFRVSRSEILEEFEAQIEAFKKNVGPIPFLNGTQHLHILPGVAGMVAELCQKHGIPKVRFSSVNFSEMLFTKTKLFGSLMILVNSAWASLRFRQAGLSSLGATYGITVSGHTDANFIDFVLGKAKHQAIELVMHPGFECPSLRTDLPENYALFDWELELKSLQYLKEKCP